MAARPTLLYRWATAVGALLTAPTSAKQDSGFVDHDYPAADMWNAVWNNTYNWLLYVQDLYNQGITWTAAHIFQAAVTFNATVSMLGNLAVAGATALGAVTATSLNVGSLTVPGAASFGASTFSADPSLPNRSVTGVTFQPSYGAGSRGTIAYKLPGHQVFLHGDIQIASPGTPSTVQACTLVSGYAPGSAQRFMVPASPSVVGGRFIMGLVDIDTGGHVNVQWQHMDDGTVLPTAAGVGQSLKLDGITYSTEF